MGAELDRWKGKMQMAARDPAESTDAPATSTAPAAAPPSSLRRTTSTMSVSIGYVIVKGLCAVAMDDSCESTISLTQNFVPLRG
jgi:hypothetical protein